MLKKFNEFDGSKDLITLFILILSIGMTIITFISSDISSWSYQYVKPTIDFSITIGKPFILRFMVWLTLYSLYQIFVSRSIIHNRLMVFGLIFMFAYVYILVAKHIIIGPTSSALLILLSVTLIGAYVNLLHKT